MKIYLARHGETDYNKEQRYQGFLDIELNETGRSQAKEAGKSINVKFDVVYSSPLIRAQETACLISGWKRDEIITDDRIKEINLGMYEGMKYMEVDDEFRKFFVKPEEYVGINGAESFESLFARVWEFLNEIVEKYEKTDKNILVLSHGAAIHAMLCQIQETKLEDFWEYPVGNCKVIELECVEKKLILSR